MSSRKIIREGIITIPCSVVTVARDKDGKTLPVLRDVPNTQGEMVKFQVYNPDMYGISDGIQRTCVARGDEARRAKRMNLKHGSRVAIVGYLVHTEYTNELGEVSNFHEIEIISLTYVQK